MARKSVLFHFKELRRPVATTGELSDLSGRSLSATVQALNHLAGEGLVFKVHRGIWAEAGNEKLSQYSVIPFLFHGTGPTYLLSARSICTASLGRSPKR